METLQDTSAIEVVRAHTEAWSRHDWEAARAALADDVHVIVNTTQPIMEPTDLTGADDYMVGLQRFADGVEPGTLVVNEAIGDDRNALLLVTAEATFGPDSSKVTLPAARLYAINDEGKIQEERVIFFTSRDQRLAGRERA